MALNGPVHFGSRFGSKSIVPNFMYFSVYEPSHVGKSGWLCTFLCVAIRVEPKLSRRYEMSQSSPFYQETYSNLLMKVGLLDVLCAYFPERWRVAGKEEGQE